MSQLEKARAFSALHQQPEQLVLYNIWDAGGARAVVQAGAQAVATGSWSMAAAHGYNDGESIPLDLVATLVTRICTSVDVPVTVDIEGGYATDPTHVAANIRTILRAGAVGINFEDRVVDGDGLHAAEDQADRISAIRAMADDEGIPLFINARTDVFLGSDTATHPSLVDAALARAAAYASAGANGFFVPGLTDTALIADVTRAVSLPVNVMMLGAVQSVADVAGCGVRRFSYGPAPFLNASKDLENRACNL